MTRHDKIIGVALAGGTALSHGQAAEVASPPDLLDRVAALKAEAREAAAETTVTAPLDLAEELSNVAENFEAEEDTAAAEAARSLAGPEGADRHSAVARHLEEQMAPLRATYSDAAVSRLADELATGAVFREYAASVRVGARMADAMAGRLSGDETAAYGRVAAALRARAAELETFAEQSDSPSREIAVFLGAPYPPPDLVRNVTVDLRKARPQGDFAESVTLPLGDEAGVSRSATYRYLPGLDPDPSTYRYRVEWILRDGQTLTDPEAGWHATDRSAIALVSPVTTTTVMFEGDLERLRDAGIVEATLHFRRPVAGEPRTAEVTLPALDGAPVAEAQIAIDTESRPLEAACASRLVLGHESHGALALPWRERDCSPGFVWARVPDELYDALTTESDHPAIAAAQAAAEDADADAPGTSDLVPMEDR